MCSSSGAASTEPWCSRCCCLAWARRSRRSGGAGRAPSQRGSRPPACPCLRDHEHRGMLPGRAADRDHRDGQVAAGRQLDRCRLRLSRAGCGRRRRHQLAERHERSAIGGADGLVLAGRPPGPRQSGDDGSSSGERRGAPCRVALAPGPRARNGHPPKLLGDQRAPDHRHEQREQAQQRRQEAKDVSVSELVRYRRGDVAAAVPGVRSGMPVASDRMW